MSNTRRLRPPDGISETADEQGTGMTQASDDAAAPGTPAGETEADPPEDRTFKFMGETFRVAGKIGTFAVIQFQRYGDTADPRAMGALHALIEDIVHPDDWQRFSDAAIAGKASDDDLAAVVVAGLEAMAMDTARREDQRRRAIPQDRQPPQRRQPGRR